MKKRLLNIDEAAEYLSRTVWAVRELQYRYGLRFLKVGKRVQFDIHDLDDFIEKHKTEIDY